MTLVKKKKSFLNDRSKDQFVDELKKNFDPCILQGHIFGSFLSDQFNADSDLDLLIVLETDLPFHQRHQLLPQLTSFLDRNQISSDLLIYTPPEFEKLWLEGKNSNVGFWRSLVHNAKQIK